MPAPSVQISTCALTLRPVAARVVSYGRSNKMAQRKTLYVLRVARGGREWFVARRFSEFRALDAGLREALSRPHAGANRSRPCAQCRELARRVTDVAFPSRFPVRSSFASSRDKIESARLHQLDAFVQVLMETTQGLLANQDDDDDEEEDEEADYDGCDVVEDEREDRCDALRIIREFLLVHDHFYGDKKRTTSTSTTTMTLAMAMAMTNQQQDTEEPLATTNDLARSPLRKSCSADDAVVTPPRRRSRLASSGSFGVATTTFRVQELDVMYRPSSPLTAWGSLGVSGNDALATTLTKASSPNVLDDDELDQLFLADYASPTEDAVIHRQLETDSDPAGQVLHHVESVRMIRRL